MSNPSTERKTVVTVRKKGESDSNSSDGFAVPMVLREDVAGGGSQRPRLATADTVNDELHRDRHKRARKEDDSKRNALGDAARLASSTINTDHFHASLRNAIPLTAVRHPTQEVKDAFAARSQFFARLGSDSRVVLSEEEYVDALERIIAREYLPDLHDHLYGEGVTGGGRGKGEEEGEGGEDSDGIEIVEVGGAGAARPAGAGAAAGEAGAGAAGTGRPALPMVRRRRDELSLSEFQALYTSEDNASAAELGRMESDRKRARYWWLQQQQDRGDRAAARLSGGGVGPGGGRGYHAMNNVMFPLTHDNAATGVSRTTAFRGASASAGGGGEGLVEDSARGEGGGGGGRGALLAYEGRATVAVDGAGAASASSARPTTRVTVDRLGVVGPAPGPAAAAASTSATGSLATFGAALVSRPAPSATGRLLPAGPTAPSINKAATRLPRGFVLALNAPRAPAPAFPHDGGMAGQSAWMGGAAEVADPSSTSLATSSSALHMLPRPELDPDAPGMEPPLTWGVIAGPPVLLIEESQAALRAAAAAPPPPSSAASSSSSSAPAGREQRAPPPVFPAGLTRRPSASASPAPARQQHRGGWGEREGEGQEDRGEREGRGRRSHATPLLRAADTPASPSPSGWATPVIAPHARMQPSILSATPAATAAAAAAAAAVGGASTPLDLDGPPPLEPAVSRRSPSSASSSGGGGREYKLPAASAREIAAAARADAAAAARAHRDRQDAAMRERSVVVPAPAAAGAGAAGTVRLSRAAELLRQRALHLSEARGDGIGF